jgi:ribosomal protein S18 acetylase RimI-like enzyme
VIIQQASLDDAEEILALQKLCYQREAEIYSDYNIPPLIQQPRAIKTEFKKYYFLKSVENGKIIGSVRARMTNPENCYIGRLIVHPDFQNQGIGTRLMDEIEEIFSECYKWELMTGHLSGKNIKLYENRGYNIIKTEKLTKKITLVYLEKTNKNK